MWKRILLFSSSVHVVIIINIDDVVIVNVLVAMEIPPIHKRFIVMKCIKVDQQTDFRVEVCAYPNYFVHAICRQHKHLEGPMLWKDFN